MIPSTEFQWKMGQSCYYSSCIKSVELATYMLLVSSNRGHFWASFEHLNRLFCIVLLFFYSRCLWPLLPISGKKWFNVDTFQAVYNRRSYLHTYRWFYRIEDIFVHLLDTSLDFFAGIFYFFKAVASDCLFKFKMKNGSMLFPFELY